MPVSRLLQFIPFQQPTLANEPPAGGSWVHEVKYDGYRTQLIVENGAARAFTRRGFDWTERYQPVADAAAKLPCQSAILDGEMIVTGAWWDYVDIIAAHRLSAILQRQGAAMKREMLGWSTNANMWKRRSAILCQLKAKEQTDLEFLYACIEPSLDSQEFFLRKAIGWALRQYAWTDPEEVRRYVARNKERLSGLSRREALKNIGALA